jgi:hypothetical protein
LTRKLPGLEKALKALRAAAAKNARVAKRVSGVGSIKVKSGKKKTPKAPGIEKAAGAGGAKPLSGFGSSPEQTR